MKVKINHRLEKVASLVEDGSTILDVGCDHALLDVYLLQNKKDIRAIASDIKEGPLVQARENIKKYQLQSEIKVKQGNGIDPIEEGVDTVIISGMGGLNIVGILKYKMDLLKNVHTLILSPNNDVHQVRKEISKLGFYIDDEILVFDKGFFYPILRFKRGKKKYRAEEYLFGPVLLQQRGDSFLAFMNRERVQKEKLLEILPKKYFKKRWQLKKELRMIRRYL